MSRETEPHWATALRRALNTAPARTDEHERLLAEFEQSSTVTPPERSTAVRIRAEIRDVVAELDKCTDAVAAARLRRRLRSLRERAVSARSDVERAYEARRNHRRQIEQRLIVLEREREVAALRLRGEVIDRLGRLLLHELADLDPASRRTPVASADIDSVVRAATLARDEAAARLEHIRRLAAADGDDGYVEHAQDELDRAEAHLAVVRRRRASIEQRANDPTLGTIDALVRDVSSLAEPEVAEAAARSLLAEDGRYVLHPAIAYWLGCWHAALARARPKRPTSAKDEQAREASNTYAVDAMNEAIGHLLRPARTTGPAGPLVPEFRGWVKVIRLRVDSAVALARQDQPPGADEIAELTGVSAELVPDLARARPHVKAVVRAELARLYGVSARSIDRWVERYAPPP